MLTHYGTPGDGLILGADPDPDLGADPGADPGAGNGEQRENRLVFEGYLTPFVAQIGRFVAFTYTPRLAIANHGGKISLVDIREGKLFISMSGGCQGISMGF